MVKLAANPQPTSVKAAELVWPKVGSQRDKILYILAKRPAGLTDIELQLVTGMGESSERPRRLELVEAGWVENSGQVRSSLGHGEAIVWRLTAEGRLAFGGAEPF